jgi:hypothetical protein
LVKICSPVPYGSVMPCKVSRPKHKTVRVWRGLTPRRPYGTQ